VSLGSDIKGCLPAGLPPADTLERALWRAEIITDMYDEKGIEPQQNLGDVLTDLVHYADAHGLNIHAAFEKGLWMADEERSDWGLPKINPDERMFR
jgi:hypothetical protein